MKKNKQVYAIVDVKLDILELVLFVGKFVLHPWYLVEVCA